MLKLKAITTMVDKKSAVKVLFNASFEQKHIAKILRLTEATVSKYVKEGKLREKRLEFGIHKQTSEENALAALAHQTKVVRMITEKLAENLHDDLNVEELKACLIPKGEVDAVQKLFTTIKGKELDWSAMVQILRNFMAWVKEVDIELAQELVPHVDNYINEKRKTL